MYQSSAIKTVEVIDEYEPTEEGLTKVEIKRYLAVLEIELTKKSGILDEKAKGF